MNEPERNTLEVAEARRSWSRVAAAALGAMAISLLVVLVVNRELIPPVLIFAVVFAIVAGATLRWGDRRWMLLVAAAVALLAMLGNLPFLLADIAHPETAAGFVPGVALLGTGVVAVIAGLAGAFAGAPRARWPLAGAGVVIVAVLAVVSLAATVTLDDDDRLDGDVELVAENFEFPEMVQVASGGALYVENKDLIRHTFVIDDAGIEQELPGSTNRRVEISLSPGTYRFHCSVPGHEDMEGTLEVS